MRWLLFALHAGMHNREHIPLPCPGLLIRRSGYYMAASSVSILVCIKHRTIPYDRRTSTRYGNRSQHGRGYLIFWFQEHTTLGGLYLRHTYFPSCNLFLGRYHARVFVCLLLFYLPPPFSRSCFFNVVNVISSFSPSLFVSHELSRSNFGVSALIPLVHCLPS